MKITIQGQDYTSALDASRPLAIERRLNEPSTCQFCLCLSVDEPLATPARCDAITIVGDDSTLYFTGYVAISPLME